VRTPLVSGVMLMAAGLYQLTPFKRACLQACQSPAGFLVKHWRAGRAGAFRIGLRHGWYCLGCCWALMLLLFAGGVMNLAVITGLLACVIAIAAMTLPELVAGRSVVSGSHHTTIFGGHRSTSSSTTKTKTDEKKTTTTDQTTSTATQPQDTTTQPDTTTTTPDGQTTTQPPAQTQPAPTATQPPAAQSQPPAQTQPPATTQPPPTTP